MLVLSREMDEAIVLDFNGTRVEVKVVRLAGNNVRLGVTGPPEVTIYRKEIQDRIDAKTAALPRVKT